MSLLAVAVSTIGFTWRWRNRRPYEEMDCGRRRRRVRDRQIAGARPLQADDVDMMSPRVLVAGIGNIFLGDDGFAVEVVKRLASEPLEDGVEVADFGLRGVHLAYELADKKYDAVILVDAVPRGGTPGTLYAIEPEPDDSEPEADADPHGMTPSAVLRWLRRIGGHCGRVVVVGCEPASLDEAIGLSEPVAAAVGGAVKMIRSLIAKLQAESGELIADN
jgi:hydrogenase maturation protease